MLRVNNLVGFGLILGASKGITLVGTNTGGGTTSMPAGLREGDYVVVQCAADSNDINSVSGWTTIQTRLSSARGILVAKFMGASPDANISVSAAQSVCIMAFRGVDTSTPQDVSNTNDSSGSNSLPNPPAINPDTENCAIVISAALDDRNAGGSIVAPSGFEDVISSSDGSENATAMMAWKIHETATSINPGNFTGGGNDEWWAATQALRPAS